MNKLSDSQYRMAFENWFCEFPEPQIDLQVIPFLTSDIQGFQKGGGLRKARKASLLSTGQVAQNLGISRSAYAKFESREEEGLVTLQKLSELAKGLDCELVYALRPKSKVRFAVKVWKKILPAALRHSWVRTRPKEKKAAALAAIAKRILNDPSFRQEQGWTKRKNS